MAGNATVGAAQYAVCAACHGADGAGQLALNAPKIAGQSAWYLKRQLQNYKGGLRGAPDGDDVYGRQMAPMAATLVNDAAINNVIAHIQTLPDIAAESTSEFIGGDVANGAQSYVVCAYCHGPQGQGYKHMNAPRLAGMTDWYLKSQLENFQKGIRGDHLKDFDGKQMMYMADTLHSEKDLIDLVAYINSL
jgi:cytochrome c oxidase subunit 2